MLAAKLIAIESGKVFGAQMSITIDDEERDRLYAMVREAQLRGISPLAITKQQKKIKLSAAATHKGGEEAEGERNGSRVVRWRGRRVKVRRCEAARVTSCTS